MLKRVIGAAAGAAGAAAVSHAGMIDDHPFEVLRGQLDGLPTVAIVNHQGTAIAVELDAERATIVRGLAAGAILSDLREAAVERANVTHQVRSGAPYSSVRVDGELLVGPASRAETLAAIEALPQLSEAQKRELIGLLALE